MVLGKKEASESLGGYSFTDEWLNTWYLGSHYEWEWAGINGDQWKKIGEKFIRN